MPEVDVEVEGGSSSDDEALQRRWMSLKEEQVKRWDGPWILTVDLAQGLHIDGGD